MNTMPESLPEELANACKCVPIDADWPIQSPMHALALLAEWDKEQGIETDYIHQVHRLTHSHAHELEDLRKMGVERLYKESIFTKYVSISWHLAGRYEYDVGFIAELNKTNWRKSWSSTYSLLDFGAAPWIQAIFYAKKGLRVTAVNQTVDSDVNRFGQWLAKKSGVSTIETFGSDDPAWQKKRYDIIYAVDVLEHIPPEADGTPGWVKYAEMLYDCLVPGGIWYVNAPLDKDDAVPHEVSYHPVHFTSPYSMEEWAVKKGMKMAGFSCGWRK